MSKTDEETKQTHQVSTEEEEGFPARWTRRFQYAKTVWEWWPDRTKVAEFIEFVRLVVS